MIEQRSTHRHRRFDAWARPDLLPGAAEIVAPVGLGLVLAGILLLGRQLPAGWEALLVLASAALMLAPLVNDLRKLLLIVIIVDVALGLGTTLATRPGNVAGPTGLSVSLITMAVLIGYTWWLAGRPGSNRRRIHPHPEIMIPALLFFFAMLLSIFQTTEVWFGFSQLFLEAQFILLCFFVLNQVRTWRDLRLLLAVLVMVLLLESALMLLQVYTGFEWSTPGIKYRTVGSYTESAPVRVAGTLGGPNVAGRFLAATLAITCGAYLTGGRLVNRGLALLAMLTGLAGLALTQARAGWIAFAAAMVCLAALAIKRRVGVRALMWLLVLAVILGLGFSTILVERFTTPDRGSAAARLYQSQLALNIIKTRPLTGVGVNNQRSVIYDPEFQPPELLGAQMFGIHNGYLSIWLETGLLGLLAFVWLLLAAGWRALQASLRTQDRYASIAIAGLLAGLIAVMVHMSSAPYTGLSLQILWLIIALIGATSRIATDADQPVPW